MNEFWDNRYSEPDYAYGESPNAFLVAQKSYLRAGMRALAVADGEGRNGVWLAQQGLTVVSVDGSAVGLDKARALARARGTEIETIHTDLTTWTWPQDSFDVVVAIYIHFPQAQRARMHRAMLAALKPGGVLLLEAFTLQQLQFRSGGPPVAEMLYSAEMLRADFAAAKILQLEEKTVELAEGKYHRGSAAVVRLVCQR